jgi:[ribosomal protein S18]-alanine N-acetyltransferase
MTDPISDAGSLTPFESKLAEEVLAWVTSPDEASAWAGADLADGVGLFARWHRDPDVHPFVLRIDGALCGYGEVWEDRDEDEAEIARVLIRPDLRGRGLGRRLVGMLVARASGAGFDQVWLRVVPENVAAIACYLRAGFARTTPELEARFNAGQPRPYVWMRFEPD